MVEVRAIVKMMVRNGERREEQSSVSTSFIIVSSSSCLIAHFRVIRARFLMLCMK